MALLGEETGFGSLLPTRQINVPIDSRYGSTRLLQVTDDRRRRGTTAGRRLLDQARIPGLPSRLQNKVRKRLNSFVWGVWKQVPISPDSDDAIHTVTQAQGGRLDTLAGDFFGNPNFWWVIAQENGIKDPLKDLVPGTKLRIPSFKNVLATALDSSRQTVKPFVEGVPT